MTRQESITIEIWQQKLQLKTHPDLFSPRRLDQGTLAMCRQVRLQSKDRLLDLGCGYGAVGLAAARLLGTDQVVLIDLDPLAVSVASENARLNNLADVPVIQGDGPLAASGLFSHILLNPPYHTDFSVARKLIEQSVYKLDQGGKLWLVVKRLDWYRNKMKHVFGGVYVHSAEGYFILMSEKRAMRKNAQKNTKNQPTRKHIRRQQQTALNKRLKQAGTGERPARPEPEKAAATGNLYLNRTAVP